MTFFAKTNTPIKGEIRMYAPFGRSFDGITPDAMQAALDSLGQVSQLDIYIDSDGGSVSDGVGIYNILKRHPAKKKVIIDGLAASIASYVAMVGDEIVMTSNSQFMIHKAWGVVAGDDDIFLSMARALANASEIIRDAYAAKTKMKPDAVYDLMKAETWMKAPQALKLGFVDSIEQMNEPHERDAYAMVDRFFNTPEEIRLRPDRYSGMLARMSKRVTKRISEASLAK
jgi:ATP-dependent protease ClpP protease subunit